MTEKSVTVKMTGEDGGECPFGIVVPFWVIEYAEYSESGGELSLLGWLAHEAQNSDDRERALDLQAVFFEIAKNQ